MNTALGDCELSWTLTDLVSIIPEVLQFCDQILSHANSLVSASGFSAGFVRSGVNSPAILKIQKAEIREVKLGMNFK